MLADELAPHGVRAGTVTVAGTVAPGTAFAPERIAAAFVRLHRTPPDPAGSEIIFDGTDP